MRHILPILLATLLAGCGTDPEDTLGAWRYTEENETLTLDLDEPGWEYEVKTPADVGVNVSVSGGAVLNKASLGLVFNGKAGKFHWEGSTYWAKVDFSGSLSETLFGTIVTYIEERDDEPSDFDWGVDGMTILRDVTLTRVTN